MLHTRFAAGSVLLALLAACGRSDAPARRDSEGNSSTTTTSPPTTKSADWDAELGAMLLVPSDSDNSAVVLFPSEDDESLPASSAVILLNPSGDTVRTTATRTDSTECGDTPMVRIAGDMGGTWALGTVGRSAPLIRMDSIEALAAADSAKLAADIARMASALPMSNGSRFGGLPFAVIAARRFAVAGRQYVIAHLARRLNQEAQPLEERTFVIAERPDSSGERYTVTYYQRSEGTEDTAEHFDVLAGMLGRRSLLLVIARDQLARTRYELLERDSAGAWRARWSRTLSC